MQGPGKVPGELTNNLAKLSELDEHIALEKRKLEEATDETTKDRIAKLLRERQDERAARLEATSATRETIRSQISRIRETLHRILHEDKTLAERIKTLFREQGITIVSILTALGMIISTIVLALPGGGTAAAPRKGRGQRVDQKTTPKSRKNPGQAGWQGGRRPPGDHWLDRLLAPVSPRENHGLVI